MIFHPTVQGLSHRGMLRPWLQRMSGMEITGFILTGGLLVMGKVPMHQRPIYACYVSIKQAI